MSDREEKTGKNDNGKKNKGGKRNKIVAIEMIILVLLIMAALQTVPSNIYEAAELDSTPKWRVFFKITLPMISPTILFTSVVASIASFKIFDSVNVMTQGGPVDSTNTLVYYIYSFAFRYGKPGMACAADLTDPGMHHDLRSVRCRKETCTLSVKFPQFTI